ncbi:MAG: TonB-dependent receptor [Janthinobacterium lividum]
MRRTDHALALAVCLVVAAAPAAAQVRAFAVPPGPLGNALAQFGAQAGLTIGISDAVAAAARTRGVTGSFGARAALARLLAGTGCAADFIDAGTVVVRRLPAAAGPGSRPPPQSAPGPSVVGTDIVVTASKQGTLLDRFAGTVDVVDLGGSTTIGDRARGTDSIAARLPVLQSTHLGPGRDKLFIRGISDSSFNGPTQATVGQYLGDVRLNYNAPDPNLNLYDIDKVEVLEGPQGTLYGTGSLGGIVRLVPRAPDLDRIGGSVAAGISATEHGGGGGDLAAMVNLPLVDGRLGVRAVAFGTLDPGYIDDPGRDLRDINRSTSRGGRLTVRYQPDDRWTIDAGGVLQDINSRDGQYAVRGADALTRSSTIAQPFDNDFALADVAVTGHLGDTVLTSTSSLVRHDVGTTYDATGYPGTGGPQRFDEDIAITLLAHETRLSGESADGAKWVAGAGIVHDIERLRRRLGPPDHTAAILGVRNEVTEGALFGQYSRSLLPRVTATLGGRATYTAATGQSLDDPFPRASRPRRDKLAVTPTAALAWQVDDRLLAFVHYQRGFRAGGLAVSSSDDPREVERFRSDRLATFEGGLRFGTRGRDPFAASASVSYARWSDIQSDLISPTGLPYTANIGNGEVTGVEVQLSWTPLPGLTVDAAAFLNDSTLNQPAPAFAAAAHRELPNIPEAATRLRAAYVTDLSARTTLTLDASIRYDGKSELGIGAPIDLPQGNVIDTSAGARLRTGRIGWTIELRNLADTKGNRFAFGNPFSVATGDQVTPLRPRTIRIGLDASF